MGRHGASVSPVEGSLAPRNPGLRDLTSSVPPLSLHLETAVEAGGFLRPLYPLDSQSLRSGSSGSAQSLVSVP